MTSTLERTAAAVTRSEVGLDTKYWGKESNIPRNNITTTIERTAAVVTRWRVWVRHQIVALEKT